MIIELTKNKYSKIKIGKNNLESMREFFIENREIWYNSNDLTMLLGIKNVRPIINKLRNSGEPIISSHKGYKYSLYKDDIKDCYYKLRLRALIALTAARKLKNHF